MKKFLLLTALTLPLGVFAQEPNTNINPPPQQAQNINYFDQLDNNNSLGNSSGKINDDINPIQTNIAVQQQANPPAQEQQKKSSGSILGSEENTQTKKPYCKDCDAVHKALAAAHASSGSSHHKKSFSLNRWAKKISARTDMKMKKVFARKYKVKTSYAVCFNWH